MVLWRNVKVTLKRAKDVNACTGFLSGFKSRTLVTAKASFENLAYTTNRVEDMGQNPVWEDGTNEFHFEFGDSSDFITLELFNRNNGLIGTSKLHFSELAHLRPGEPAEMTLSVMVSPSSKFGDLILDAEILTQQAMGEKGLLMAEVKKGQLKKITSFFRGQTANIKAKLTYKHTTFTSGVLENTGNKFIWQECNVFAFMINSDVKLGLDVLKIEIYNADTKVGEAEMLMSLFLEENNLRGLSSEFVTHTADLSKPNRSVVGNIEVRARFIPNPNPVSVSQGSSVPWTRHKSRKVVHTGVPATQHTFYPDIHINAEPQFVQDPLHKPSAPPMHVPLHQQSPWGGPAAPPPACHQPAAGAPAGPSFQRSLDDPEIMDFCSSFH